MSPLTGDATITEGGALEWFRPAAIEGVSGPLPELAVRGYLVRGAEELSFAGFRLGAIPPGHHAECLPACGLSAMKATWLEEFSCHSAVAVFGCMVGEADQLRLAQFLPNPRFVRLLHTTISILGTDDSELQRLAAATQGDPYCYLLDARTPEPEGRVPLEDILGCFKIAHRTLVPDSYAANERSHQLLTRTGMFQLTGHYQRGLFVWFKNNAVPEGFSDSTPPYATW